MNGTMKIYALDRPVYDNGGLQHVQQALRGEQNTPANYTFSSFDGTSIVYHVCGYGPILLVATCPGWGGGLNYIPEAFLPLTQSGKLTLVVIQTRGTLPSKRPIDERLMGSRHMAADINSLRQHLRQDAINIFGHSNGAAIALGYAELFPQHCKRAILVSTQLLGYINHATTALDVVTKLQKDPRFRYAANQFMARIHSLPETDEEFSIWKSSIIPLYFYNPAKSQEYANTVGRALIQTWAYFQQDEADRLPEASMLRDLNKVTATALIITGANDFICGPPASNVVAEALGDKARHVIYHECGHMPWIERKEAFFTDILEFLQSELI
ncbi:hypothetical protein NQ176_g7523 [Zarea fungicola]|uniref:Uncharacterized protein n=1 Tax=Zarea fungicola TaxID=93591 RepID=A0ACC1MZI5_9HYPO|nr:hypothetical protein NQ176_g7523 [Lecanicillium fungicola]